MSAFCCKAFLCGINIISNTRPEACRNTGSLIWQSVQGDMMLVEDVSVAINDAREKQTGEQIYSKIHEHKRWSTRGTTRHCTQSPLLFEQLWDQVLAHDRNISQKIFREFSEKTCTWSNSCMKSRPLIRFNYICGLNPNLTLKSSLPQSASLLHSSNYLQLNGNLYDVVNLFLLITRNGKYKYERCLDGFQSLTSVHLVTFSSLAVLHTSPSLPKEPQQETGSPIWPWSWSRFLPCRGVFLASVACWGSGLGFL